MRRIKQSMKKNILTLLVVLFNLCSQAQIINNSFENWEVKNGDFSFEPFITADTFDFFSPVGWTSSNSVTMGSGLKHTVLVDSVTDAFEGNKAVKMHTDSIYIDAAGIYLTIPGFIVNGNFKLRVNDLFGLGGVNPANLSGGGMPVNERKKGFRLRYKYTPVASDSCLIWAVLKSHGDLVADAKFSTTQTVSSYTYLEKEFTYYTCNIPDTLVIIIASSTPDFTTLGSGTTGLQPGSVLIVDSVQITDAAGGYNFPPIAKRDIVYTFKNTPDTFSVLANDVDCENDPLQVTILQGPVHGTAVLNAVQDIEYNPATNYLGRDSVVYQISDGFSTAKNTLDISVFNRVTGIANTPLVNVTIKYLTGKGQLYIENPYALTVEIQLTNMLGSVVATGIVPKGGSQLDISNLPAGVYVYRVSDGASSVAGRICHR